MGSHPLVSHQSIQEEKYTGQEVSRRIFRRNSQSVPQATENLEER